MSCFVNVSPVSIRVSSQLSLRHHRGKFAHIYHHFRFWWTKKFLINIITKLELSAVTFSVHVKNTIGRHIGIIFNGDDLLVWQQTWCRQTKSRKLFLLFIKLFSSPEFSLPAITEFHMQTIHKVSFFSPSIERCFNKLTGLYLISG